MNAFVTGGTGYVGSVLIDKLLERDYKVKALLRPSSRHKKKHRKGLTYVEGELSNLEALAKGMEGADQVYHLAGYARVWSPNPDLYYKVNVEGTENILQTAMDKGVDKVVVTSSGATLPPSDGSMVNESDRKEKFFNEYERTKYLAEESAVKYSEQGLFVVIVNPTRIYGPGPLSQSNAVTRVIKWYDDGKLRFIPGDGTSRGNYTYVEDVAEGHIKALEKGRSGERYILGGHNLTFNEIVELLTDATGIRRSMIHLPQKWIERFARFEQWKARTFNIEPLITPAWVGRYFHNWKLSSQKAIDELDYEITPAEEAFKTTVDWIRSLD